ncbi:hypothetical protein CNYM01_14237 [Colletotrichum nymphaeae SA-01]|uniref:Uncharacterized protein n=1 Tax=Colletotrichum nymphaeae SA-01 TaxID=1460502 RepID=A0A135UFL6_9PEZI|nr:hypothetical protein CNYM01_14237 [Colletotrichum nymphaeae SA-01]
MIGLGRCVYEKSQTPFSCRLLANPVVTPPSGLASRPPRARHHRGGDSRLQQLAEKMLRVIRWHTHMRLYLAICYPAIRAYTKFIALSSRLIIHATEHESAPKRSRRPLLYLAHAHIPSKPDESLLQWRVYVLGVAIKA